MPLVALCCVARFPSRGTNKKGASRRPFCCNAPTSRGVCLASYFFLAAFFAAFLAGAFFAGFAFFAAFFVAAMMLSFFGKET